MISSAEKGNLPTSALVLENGKVITSSESLVASNHDQTAHAERLAVTKMCKLKKNHYTPGLTMITVVESCLMCLSACSQAGYKENYFIIPAKRYVDKIPWMTDTEKVDKSLIADQFSSPLKLHQLKEYEEEFCKVFERVYSSFLK